MDDTDGWMEGRLFCYKWLIPMSMKNKRWKMIAGRIKMCAADQFVYIVS